LPSLEPRLSRIDPFSSHPSSLPLQRAPTVPRFPRSRSHVPFHFSLPFLLPPPSPAQRHSLNPLRPRGATRRRAVPPVRRGPHPRGEAGSPHRALIPTRRRHPRHPRPARHLPHTQVSPSLSAISSFHRVLQGRRGVRHTTILCSICGGETGAGAVIHLGGLQPSLTSLSFTFFRSPDAARLFYALAYRAGSRATAATLVRALAAAVASLLAPRPPPVPTAPPRKGMSLLVGLPLPEVKPEDQNNQCSRRVHARHRTCVQGRGIDRR